MQIDAHQHFWSYDPQKHAWIDDSMAKLKRDFLPDDLWQIYQANGIDGCVAVQADQSEAETDFLLQLAAQHDFIKGVVGWIDLRADTVEERLAHYAQFPKLKGFRHVVQDEPDPDFMLRADFQHGISLLQQYQFTYDILIFPTQFEAAIKTVRQFPAQQFVLDHIAKPYIKKGEIEVWRDHIQELANHPNVYCKISGMVTEADWNKWTYEDFVPYLDVVFHAFGAARILFGSDWPVCLLGGSYQAVKSIVDQYVSQYNDDVQASIFGANATKFYRL